MSQTGYVAADMRVCRILFIAALLALIPTGFAGATDTWTQVVPGVQYLHRTTSTPWSIHALVVDVTNPHVRVGTLVKNETSGPDGGETVRGMASRHGALAAINADYFQFGTAQDHQPQGLALMDGLQVGGFVNGRLSWAMNGTTLESFMGVYASTFPYSVPSWMFNVASGGPRLVRNGMVAIENTSGLPDAYARNPRTALGISQDKTKLILAVVDGRLPGFSVGMTGPELGAFLIELGAWDGMGFDSGGSSTFYLGGSVVNTPSDGAERKVADAIAVWDTFDPGPNPTVALGTGFEGPDYQVGDISGQQGWSRAGTVTAVQAAHVHSGTQALELDQAYADKTYTSTNDKVQWIDFWAKRQTGQGGGLCYFGNSASSLLGTVAFLNGGGINYWNSNGVGGGAYSYMTSYSLGQWYRISIRIDYNVKRYNVYVDGRQYAIGVLPQDASAANGPLGFIRFQDYGVGSFFVDDVYVGNTRFDFPRVEPDAGSVPLHGYRPFVLKNGTAAAWEILDERDPGNAAAPAGTVATIDAAGLVTARGLGSFVVQATDAVGKKDKTSRITVTNSISTGQARALPDASSLTIGSAVVTASFPDHYYVEQPDRAAGLRVNSPIQVAIGERMSLQGVLQTVNEERVLVAQWSSHGPTGDPLVPLLMTNREAVNGLDGLGAAGLLVGVSGKVTRIESDHFFISDGSVPGDGLAVTTPAGYTPGAGLFVAVDGPLGTVLDGGGYVPSVKPVSASNIHEL
ncbi:MAG: phosphodiester glycosidase family protein [Armatimonadetes bacterium]|nr:phosphodiester glycosidase family protein [Armatimonadota bacterium]